MKFEEFIDIFDNSSKLMLVATYKRLRRLKWCEKNNFVLDTISVEEDKDKKEISNIPESIYFDGERCVSHSSGKIYYRYRGDFYSDSSEKVLLKKNVSWSRRWGH